jgi:NAD(P)-dependent dehydrogenase (short-subunit alcohol dehydrogenase family)
MSDDTTTGPDGSIGVMSLAERRAIVTGGASGIGRATAVALADLGADVVVTDIDEDGGAAVAEQIGGSFAMLDVADPNAWERVVAMFGPFDLALLNAGISTNHGLPPVDGNPLVALTDDAYRRIMAINLDGVVFGMRAVLPGMIERGSGDIVATASMAGLGPIGMDPVYGLTKHGVVGLVRSLARHLDENPGSADICVSAICPGFTDTNIIGDGVRELIGAVGLEIMPADHVAGVVTRALHERVRGAQWVIWPGVEPHVYEWNPPIPWPGTPGR